MNAAGTPNDVNDRPDELEAIVAESARWSESAEEREVLFWCVPLTRALEAKEHGLAMSWLIASTRCL
jgi:hypothetical protein